MVIGLNFFSYDGLVAIADPRMRERNYSGRKTPAVVPSTNNQSQH